MTEQNNRSDNEETIDRFIYRILYRRFAWASRGTKVYQNITGKPFLRTSIIAGLRNNGLMATLEYRGYCNTALILSWVEQVLVPELEVGDVVIWDNASFHKSPKIKALIEQVKSAISRMRIKD